MALRAALTVSQTGWFTSFVVEEVGIHLGSCLSDALVLRDGIEAGRQGSHCDDAAPLGARQVAANVARR